jgi:hypothetical protein
MYLIFQPVFQAKGLLKSSDFSKLHGHNIIPNMPGMSLGVFRAANRPHPAFCQ